MEAFNSQGSWEQDKNIRTQRLFTIRELNVGVKRVTLRTSLIFFKQDVLALNPGIVGNKLVDLPLDQAHPYWLQTYLEKYNNNLFCIK